MSAAEKLTEEQAARHLGISKASLTRARYRGEIYPIRMGQKIIRYTHEILDEYRQRKALSVETIMSQALASRTSLTTGTGVYVLWRGDEITYIGKSATFHTRLASHLLTSKEFDAYAFVPVHPDLVNEAEAMLIRELMPRHNVQYARVT